MTKGAVFDFVANGALVGIGLQHANEKTDNQSDILIHYPLQEVRAV